MESGVTYQRFWRCRVSRWRRDTHIREMRSFTTGDVRSRLEMRIPHTHTHPKKIFCTFNIWITSSKFPLFFVFKYNCLSDRYLSYMELLQRICIIVRSYFRLVDALKQAFPCCLSFIKFCIFLRFSPSNAM